MMLKNGGSAFPTFVGFREGDIQEVESKGGITALDYFAGQALMGMMADTTINGASNDKLSKIAYDLGAAMLAEKQRRDA